MQDTHTYMCIAICICLMECIYLASLLYVSHLQEIIWDLGRSTARIVIGRMLSQKKRNRSSFANEKVQVIGAGVRGIEVVTEAVAGKVSTLVAVTGHHSHVSMS